MIFEGATVLYSGGTTHSNGVSQEIAKSLLEWQPVSDRILTVNRHYTKVCIVQVYAPTNAASENEIEDFYNILEATLATLPHHNMKLVIGDFNAHIGPEKEDWEIIGKEGVGTRFGNGENLLNFCRSNDMKIGGTLFSHKNIHKWTWQSLNRAVRNQIDHICITKHWASSLRDIRLYRGADIGSDHYLLIADLRLKLKKLVHQCSRRILDMDTFGSEEMKEQFELKLQNSFSALDHLKSDEESFQMKSGQHRKKCMWRPQ